MVTETQIDDLHFLLATLPAPLQAALKELSADGLLEVVMDLGRLPQARLPGRALALSARAVTHADLAHVLAQVGEFSADNRAGIEGTLHRISCLRNRKGEVVGLTLRVGRAVFGTIDLIRDLIESGKSLLLLGRPGVGKTTKLREVARVLADDFGKRVIVIDTSNEIAGDGDIPHPAIGSARRMQVPHPERQHAVMIEAVENHMPEAIIVDEIGTEAETLAARTIAERGVQLIGTAHGTTLENLVNNPTLSDLVGGVQTVTLGDEEARLRGTQKTIAERRAPPTFDVVVEIVSHDEVIVHRDTAAAVDALLRGADARGERRRRKDGGHIEAEVPVATTPPRTRAPVSPPHAGPVRIYPYAVSRDSLDRVIRDLGLHAWIARRAEQADLIVALRSRGDDPRLHRLVQATGAPVHLIKRNTTAQMRHTLQDVFHVLEGVDEDAVSAAVQEAEQGVRHVLDAGVAVELAPRPPALRKLQHRVVVRHQLVAQSAGREPHRHLVIFPMDE